MKKQNEQRITIPISTHINLKGSEQDNLWSDQYDSDVSAHSNEDTQQRSMKNEKKKDGKRNPKINS